MGELDVRWLGRADYLPTWNLQRELAGQRARGEICDTLLILEHNPVYTLGRETKPEHISAGRDYLRALGAEVMEIDRGGSVTFHGPGQLVAYPILHLASCVPVTSDPHQGDVVRYLRILEEALIKTVA